MRVVITGGSGFLGRKLAAALLAKGELAGQPIDKIVLADLAPAEDLRAQARLELFSGDLSESATLERLLSADVAVVYHLAAVVSGAAERDFDLGMRVNLVGSQRLLDVCRRLGSKPQVLFASSVAVYGGDLPAVIEDHTALTPQNSYGAQKAVVELLFNDYSRKGFIDGRVLRLPTVVVRPGKPNQAASSFASGIIREPLNGEASVCPVDPRTELWVMSPRRVVEALIRAAELPEQAWQPYRAVALPGLTVSVQEMIDALGRVAGAAAVEKIERRRDPAVETIVGGWAARFNPQRALRMGFRGDRDMVEIIRAYIDDELSGGVLVLTERRTRSKRSAS